MCPRHTLTARGLRSGLKNLYNEASTALEEFLTDQDQYEKQIRSASTIFRIELFFFLPFFFLFSVVKYSAPHT
jgi:hypothetical protein